MTRLESAEEELTDLRSIKEVRKFSEIFFFFGRGCSIGKRYSPPTRTRGPFFLLLL